MNVVLKISCNDYSAWKKDFDSHKERAAVCDETKTTVGKIDDKSCMVMLYDVDLVGMQQLMSSDYLKKLTEKLEIVNEEMHSFEPLNQ
tara:strand:+ start:878 stop:1141 length:264 start_codon:yes stop_codon:yes gene_type:complete